MAVVYYYCLLWLLFVIIDYCGRCLLLLFIVSALYYYCLSWPLLLLLFIMAALCYYCLSWLLFIIIVCCGCSAILFLGSLTSTPSPYFLQIYNCGGATWIICFWEHVILFDRGALNGFSGCSVPAIPR